MTRTAKAVRFETADQLLDRLGGISPERIRLKPPIGTATEEDLLEQQKRTGKLFELVAGTLVEKDMGWLEALLAMRLGRLLGAFLDQHPLGELVGADGATRLTPGLVRIPDVAFYSWDRLPGDGLPDEPIPHLVPDLAIEVVSPGNTPAEMRGKREEYFDAGVRLVWLVNRNNRTIEVCASIEESTTFTEDDTLDGGDLLPGLRLPVKHVFARVPRPKTPPAKRPRQRKPKA